MVLSYELVHFPDLILSEELVHSNRMVLSELMVHSIPMVLSWVSGSLIDPGTLVACGSLTS